MTPKQKREIEFLKTLTDRKVTTDDEKEFIYYVTKGGDNIDSNPLFQAKRRLDMTIKMWRIDLMDGLVSKFELIDKNPYLEIIVNSTIKGIIKDNNSMRYILKRIFNKDVTAGVSFNNLCNIK